MPKPYNTFGSMEMINLDSLYQHRQQPRRRTDSITLDLTQSRKSRFKLCSSSVLISILILLFVSLGFGWKYKFDYRIFPEKECLILFEGLWKFTLLIFYSTSSLVNQTSLGIMDAPQLNQPNLTSIVPLNQLYSTKTASLNQPISTIPIQRSIEQFEKSTKIPNFKYRLAVDNANPKLKQETLFKLLLKIKELNLSSLDNAQRIDRLCPQFEPQKQFKQCTIDWEEISKTLKTIPKYRQNLTNVVFNRFNHEHTSSIVFNVDFKNGDSFYIESGLTDILRYTVVVHKEEISDFEQNDEDEPMIDSTEYLPTLLIPLDVDRFLLIFLKDSMETPINTEQYCVIELIGDQSLICSIKPII